MCRLVNNFNILPERVFFHTEIYSAVKTTLQNEHTNLALILTFFDHGSIFAESVEQDQTAHTCSLILLYTLRYSIINFCRRNPHSIPCKTG